MRYADELIRRCTAVVRAREVEEGTLIAFLSTGILARREGSVTEAEAMPGARWEGLAGLPLFRVLPAGRRHHISPEAPVLVIQADDAARIEDPSREIFARPEDIHPDEACASCGGQLEMAGPAGPLYCPDCDPDLAPAGEGV